jgi:hypothetical protein
MVSLPLSFEACLVVTRRNSILVQIPDENKQSSLLTIEPRGRATSVMTSVFIGAIRFLWGVKGGVKPGQCSGVKVGQWMGMKVVEYVGREEPLERSGRGSCPPRCGRGGVV